MAGELQARSEFYRLFERFNRESFLVILSSIAVIVSVISFFRSEVAIDEAKESIAIAQIWQTMYNETERECRMAQLELDAIKIELIKAGINLEHIGEKP